LTTLCTFKKAYGNKKTDKYKTYAPIFEFLAYFRDVINFSCDVISYVTYQQVLISKYDILFIASSIHTKNLYCILSHKSLFLKLMTSSSLEALKSLCMLGFTANDIKFE